ncbi:hypothetical protein GCM10022284_70710 [Streptomyces hundungensis]
MSTVCLAEPIASSMAAKISSPLRSGTKELPSVAAMPISLSSLRLVRRARSSRTGLDSATAVSAGLGGRTGSVASAGVAGALCACVMVGPFQLVAKRTNRADRGRDRQTADCMDLCGAPIQRGGQPLRFGKPMCR